MKKLVLFILVLIGLLSGVSATQINFATAGDNSLIVGYSSAVQGKVAQTFQGNNENITTVSFYYYNTLSPASNINVTIRENNGTNASFFPSRYALLNKSLVTGTSVATANLVTVTLNSSMNVTLGTTYWIVFEREDGNFSTTNYISIVRNATANTYANGSSYQFTTFWTQSSATFDFKGYINTSPVITIPTTITFNSPLNNSYYNSSVLLNISINTLSNLSYSLNGGTNTLLCLNCNSSMNVTLNNFTFGTQNLTIFANNTANSNSTINFYYDNTTPSLNVSLPSEYNYYAGFNFSRYINYSDNLGISSCIVTILGFNSTTCNNTNYNFTLIGNKTINITLTDLAGNTNTSLNNIMLINPVVYLNFNNNITSTVISNYTLGSVDVIGSLYNQTYYSIYDGNPTLNLQFVKEGYIQTNVTINMSNSTIINSTYNIQPVTIYMRVFDSETLAQLTFDVTISDTDIVTFTNITNLSKQYSEVPNGDLQFIVTSTGYSQAIFYNTLTPYSNLVFDVYMTAVNDSTVITFSVKDFDTNLALEGVLVEARLIINDTRTTVQQSLTSDNGLTYMYLNVLNDYEFVFSKDGYVLANVNSIPTTTTYTVKLRPDTTAYSYINNVAIDLNPNNDLIVAPENITFSAFISGSTISFMNFSLVTNNGTSLDYQTSINPTGTTFTFYKEFYNNTNITTITMTIFYVVDGNTQTTSKTFRVMYLRSDEIDAFKDIGADTTEEIQLFKFFIMLTIFAATIITATRSEQARDYVSGILIMPVVFFTWAGWISLLYGTVLCIVLFVLFMGANKR